MRYKVTIDRKEYEVNVESTDGELPNDSHSIGDDASLEVAQNEYNHCFDRSDKLDNKIYILLTVCAFLFVMLSEAIKKISEFRIPTTLCDLFIKSGYVAFLSLNITFFIIILVKLIKLLKGIELMRFDSYEIIHKDMISAPKKQTIRYVCYIYEKCKEHNNRLIEKQYIKFNQCVKLMVTNIILLLVLAIYRSLI